MKNLDLVAQVQNVAAAYGCSAGHLALAWALSKDEHLVPIPGTKRRKYLEENAAAVEITLSADQVKQLDEVFPPDAAAGDRYVPSMMALLNR